MIDLHSHILHGLDDGPKTLEESVEMCLISFQDGVRTVVATPHTLNGVYEHGRSAILAKVQELNSAIQCTPSQTQISELRTPNSELKILPGADVYFSAELLTQIDEGKALTIGDWERYLLLEFPFQGIPYGVEEVLFQLMVRGITPIISHPERNLEIASRTRRYFEMVRMGCLGQVTAMSLTGEFGGDEIGRASCRERVLLGV